MVHRRGKRARTHRKVKAVKVFRRDLTGKLFWNRTWSYTSAKKIPAEKMYLPNAKVEYYSALRRKGKVSLQSTEHTGADGRFAFKNVPARDAYVKIFLEHRDGKVTKFVGYKNAAATAKFEIKKDKTIWGRVDLDASKFKKRVKAVDLKEVEIDHSDFRDVCDAYHSIWFGHKQLKKIAGEDLPFIETRFPQKGKTSFFWKNKMWITEARAKRRATLLHEYSHYIIKHKLGAYRTRGYGYNDDAAGSHGPNTKEYLDAAWNEGIATFLGQAMADEAVYHSTFAMDLMNDKVTIGGHNESSVQGALWHAYKKHGGKFKDEIWKVLNEKKHRTVRTAWDYWDNWKAHLPGRVDVLQKAYKTHGMEYRYAFLATKYKAAKAPGKLTRMWRAAFGGRPKEFYSVKDLYNKFGKTGGGTEADYGEEFYNENKYRKVPLGAGSTFNAPKIKIGTSYFVPKREKNS